MSKKNILKYFVLSILFIVTVVVTVGIVAGYAMVWGVKRNVITFNDLNTSDQIMLNNSLQKVTGKPLTIKKITHSEYKNGVKNYVIKFDKAEQLEIKSNYFNELYDQSPDRRSDTGYYYKNKTLYIVIHDIDYTRINDNEEKEFLIALGELSDTLSEVFEIN